MNTPRNVTDALCRRSPRAGRSVLGQVARLVVPLVLVAAWPGQSRARLGQPPASDQGSPNYQSLVEQADLKRQAQAHAEAAMLLVEAYRVRPAKQRSDEIGEVIVDAAIAAFADAVKQPPKTAEQVRGHIELLVEEVALVQEFVESRTPAKSPPLFARTASECGTQIEVLQRQLEQLERADEDEPDDDGRPGSSSTPRPRDDGTSAEDAGAVADPIGHEPDGAGFDPRDRSQRGRGLIVTGSVLVALGAAGLGAMGAGMGMALRANEFDPSMELDQRQQQLARGHRGNQLAVVGAIVGGALELSGITMLSVGLARRRSARITVVPSGGPGLVGVSWRGRF